MPYRKRYTRKKKVVRRRKYSRSITKPKFGGKIKQPVHYFKRHVDRGTLTSDGTGTETFGTFTFTLQDVPGYTEFTNLYDSYKIVAVKIMFLPIYDNTNSGINYSIFYERMMSVIDFNDNTTPSSLSELREYRNCKVTPNNKIHKRYFYPKMLLDGIATVSPWLETSTTSTNYYGIKYGWEQATGETASRWRVECVYYMKFKSSK